MFRRGKDAGPLQQLQNSSNAVKKKTDKVISECRTLIKKPSKDQKKLDALLVRCKDSLKELDETLEKAEALKPENEPTAVDKFEEKKKALVTLLTSSKGDLSELTSQLQPESENTSVKVPVGSSSKDEVNSAPVSDRPDKGDVKEQSGEDEDEEEEEDEEECEEEEDGEEEEEEEEADEESGDEDEEEEDEEEESAAEPSVRTTPRKKKKKFVALEDFAGEQDGDLGFKKGEFITCLNVRSDGWMNAMNSKGCKGLVPSNYLTEVKGERQIVKTSARDDEDDDEEEVSELDEEEEGEEEEEEEGESGGEEEEDEEEDGEEEDEESEELEASAQRSPRTGKELWNEVKQAVKETGVTDVLQALGALPAGFRDSTLCKQKRTGEYNYKTFLAPMLSSSSLNYYDLFLDQQTDKIRPVVVPIQRIVTAVSCQQMPLLAEGVEIIGRHVRICLFDGQHVLSNIVLARVSQIDRDQKTWHFSAKPETKCLELAEFAVRSNISSTNLGILFEVCMLIKRTGSEQEGEVSCGWVFLRLYDQRGAIIANKTYEETMQGGTPFEKGIVVDPRIGRKEGTNMLRSLMSSNRQPRLIIRISAPAKEQKEQLDTLPVCILCSTAYLPFISFYRQLLADKLLRQRPDIQSTEPVHCPVLSALPDIMEDPDLMDVLRTAWTEKLKTIKNKGCQLKKFGPKDIEMLRTVFVRVFLETVYPLHFLNDLGPFKVAGADTPRVAILQRPEVKSNNAASLFSADFVHKPFNISELTYNVVPLQSLRPAIVSH